MARWIKGMLVALIFLGAQVSPALADDDNPPVKKSDSGICHIRGSTYYARTKHFTPYPTLEACLKSGGRLPQRAHDDATPDMLP